MLTNLRMSLTIKFVKYVENFLAALALEKVLH